MKQVRFDRGMTRESRPTKLTILSRGYQVCNTREAVIAKTVSGIKGWPDRRYLMLFDTRKA
jgi:hypothetical protein